MALGVYVCRTDGGLGGGHGGGRGRYGATAGGGAGAAAGVYVVLDRVGVAGAAVVGFGHVGRECLGEWFSKNGRR